MNAANMTDTIGCEGKVPECGETCKEWSDWTPCKAMAWGQLPWGLRCHKEKLCIDGQATRPNPTSEECPGVKPPTCKQSGSCSSWSSWSPCQELDSFGNSGIPGDPNGTSCRKKKVCIGDPSEYLTEECPNVKPPMCTIDMSNCTKWDYKGCGPTCLRCGCCLEPFDFIGVGEWGCEPCTDGRCEPVGSATPNMRLRP